MHQIIAKANTRPELAHPLFSTFTARDPQFVVEIDREKAQVARLFARELASVDPAARRVATPPGRG